MVYSQVLEVTCATKDFGLKMEFSTSNIVTTVKYRRGTRPPRDESDWVLKLCNCSGTALRPNLGKKKVLLLRNYVDTCE